MSAGATDSKHYASLSKYGTLRHSPYVKRMEDLKRVHGVDERMSIDNFKRAICMYRTAFQRFGEFAA